MPEPGAGDCNTFSAALNFTDLAWAGKLNEA